MIKKSLVAFVVIIATLIAGIIVVYSQDNERSAFIEYVEGQISTPSYQIKLNGLEGALSSDVSFSSITIADADGIWLEIIKPKLIWTRSALLRGRLLVDTLAAEKIEFIRKPLPEEGLPAPESSSFSIPELPVAVSLENLDLPLVELGPDIIDLASNLSASGKLILDGGSLDLDLTINRLDDVGGEFKALAQYDGSAKDIVLDISLNEPENGIIASLLNIPEKPPINLSIKGDAPISELDIALAFDVAQARILDGNVKFRAVQGGLRTLTVLNGPLSKILPVQHQPFFGEQSDLQAELLFLDDGEIKLLSSMLNSGVTNLTASANLNSAGFLSALKVKGSIGSASGNPVLLPTKDKGSTIGSAIVDINYDASAQNTWSGVLELIDYAGQSISADKIKMDAFGSILELANGSGHEISFDVDGSIDVISSEDAGLADAIGQDIKLQFDGDWSSGQPVVVSRFNVFGDSYKLLADGSISDNVFSGDIKAQAEDLASFSAVTGRNLNGSILMSASGDLMPLSGGFDLTLDGNAQDLKTGSSQIDRLLEGSTLLSGFVARGENGLVFDQFSLSNRQMEAGIEGALSSELADLSLEAIVKDLSQLDANSSGRARLNVGLKGQQAPFDLDVSLALPSGQLTKLHVNELALMFKGQMDGSTVTGQFASSGFLAREALVVQGSLNINETDLTLDDFSAQIGRTNLSGKFAQEFENGLVHSDFTVKSSDISAIAALALIEATGSMDARVELSPSDENSQFASADFRAGALQIDTVRIDSLSGNLSAQDILQRPKIDAQINALGIDAAGTKAKNLSAKIDNQGSLTKFELVSELVQNSAIIETSGSVETNADLTTILVDRLQLRSTIANAQLESPAQIAVDGTDILIRPARLNVGSGFITVSGVAGDQMDMDVVARSLPLNILNAVQPGLGAQGILGATAKISGLSSAPTITFNVDGGQVSAAQIGSFNLSPLDVTGSGSFANNVISLTSFRAKNSQSLALNANGKIPLSGGGLSVNVNGTAPLAMANGFLLDRGTQLDGVVQLSAKATGSLVNPLATASLSVDGGTIVDPLSNMQVRSVRLNVRLNDINNADITLSGNFASGGSVAANGNIGLDAQLPANINIQLRSARYGDGETFSTSVNGDLLVNGSLLADPLLSGNLNLGRTEITVPESFASESSLLNVEHIDADEKVRRMLARLKAVTPNDDGNDRRVGVRIQLNINAPNQIFVRGRGLDAELGGRLGLTGTLDNIVPLGSFNLRRGRLSLLGQRLDLERGSITLAGDLDPLLNFVATTQAGDTLASIELDGTASDLKVTFSSNPELPEDEVLAKIIFGRNLTDLSPAQIVKLASIASELTGGNSPSLVDGLRQSTGLDDVDIVQDDQGNAAVKAGKYISDNVYLGVQAGKETEATINLDITDSLTARGSVGSDGESKLGIFFEKDY